MADYSYFSSVERRLLAALRLGGFGVREIARRLRRSPSTISRELRRNAPDQGGYRAAFADRLCLSRRRRVCVLDRDEGLRVYVEGRLAEGWTPGQISGPLQLGSEVGLRKLGAKAIYAWIRRQEERAGRSSAVLPRSRAGRFWRRRAARDKIPGKVHISARPEAANARQEAGHWEGDLIICKRRRPVLVLHERKNRLTLMTRLSGREASETCTSLMGMLRRLPAAMRNSITFDNCQAK